MRLSRYKKCTNILFADDADKDDPQKVLDKLAEYCSARSNEVIETHRFWNMTYNEPFDSFLTGLRSGANLCNFDDMKDRMLRDKIVFLVTDKVQELLLREKTLDLQKVVDICRAPELTSKQTKEMAGAHIDKEHTLIKLQIHFARYGIPSEIVSDQGPQFTSIQFHSMINKWGIVHTISSPGHHHQSNGKPKQL